MWRLLLVIAIGVLAEPAHAEADPGFGWRAPAGCPTAAEVSARLERRLGDAVDGAVHGVEIEVTRERGEYVANIDARALTVANSVRTLRSKRCAALADAVAVVLARLASEARDRRPAASAAPAVDPSVPAMVVAVEPAAVVPRAPLVARVSAEAPQPYPAHAPSPVGTWGGGVRVLGLSGVGALPAINLGGELGGYVRRHHHYAELAVAQWIPQRLSAQSEPSGVDVKLRVVTVRAGWASHLPIRAWGTAEVGSMTGDGMAAIAPRVGPSWWTAVGAGFGVAWPMADKVRLVGTFELVVPIGSPRFTLDSGVELWRSAPAAARSALGLEVGFR